MDRIRNDYIRGRVHVRYSADKVREARPGLDIILRLELPGRRPHGRQKRTFMDAVM